MGSSKVFLVEYAFTDKSGAGTWSMSVAAPSVESALAAVRREAKSKMKHVVQHFTECRALASFDLIASKKPAPRS